MQFDHPAVGAALAAASDLLSMDTAFIGSFSGDTFAFVRVHGDWPGLTEGQRVPRDDSLCARLLGGAPPVTADAAHDAAYADAPLRARLGVVSYAGAPVHGQDGRVLGTLCGIARQPVAVPEEKLAVLRRLADVVATVATDDGDRPALDPVAGEVVLRRTPTGWRVGDEQFGDDLVAAMSLADLLATDLPTAPRPPRPDGELDEAGRLRLTVAQLEHALAARVVVEQAIGVLAERRRLQPRPAFEWLRKAARSRGRRVHELAREVVSSAADRAVPLPPELAAPARN